MCGVALMKTRDPEPDEEVEVDPSSLSEAKRVLNWRLHQALEEGVSLREAERFAEGDGDLSMLRALVRKGWPPDLAARAA